MHFLDEVCDEEFHMLMDLAKVGDEVCGPPKPEDLKFNFQSYYYILCHTLYPQVGAYSQGKINDVLCNTLYAISCGYVFDVEDQFIRILVDVLMTIWR